MESRILTTLFLFATLFAIHAKGEEATKLGVRTTLEVSQAPKGSDVFLGKAAGNRKGCKKLSDCDFKKGLFCKDKDGKVVNEDGDKCGCLINYNIPDQFNRPYIYNMHYCGKKEKCMSKVNSPCDVEIEMTGNRFKVECSAGLKCTNNKCTGDNSDIEKSEKCSASSFSSMTFTGLIAGFLLRLYY